MTSKEIEDGDLRTPPPKPQGVILRIPDKGYFYVLAEEYSQLLDRCEWFEAECERLREECRTSERCTCAANIQEYFDGHDFHMTGCPYLDKGNESKNL